MAFLDAKYISRFCTCLLLIHNVWCMFLLKEYERRLETIFPILEQVGLKVAFKPEGSVFVFAELPDTYQKTDVCICLSLSYTHFHIHTPDSTSYFHNNIISINSAFHLYTTHIQNNNINHYHHIILRP